MELKYFIVAQNGLMGCALCMLLFFGGHKMLRFMRFLIDYNYDIMIEINSTAILCSHHHYVQFTHLFMRIICKLICENYDVENHKY